MCSTKYLITVSGNNRRSRALLTGGLIVFANALHSGYRKRERSEEFAFAYLGNARLALRNVAANIGCKPQSADSLSFEGASLTISKAN